MLNWIVWNRTDYLNKIDLVLNNLQTFIWHKTLTTTTALSHEKRLDENDIIKTISMNECIKTQPTINKKRHFMHKFSQWCLDCKKIIEVAI